MSQAPLWLKTEYLPVGKVCTEAVLRLHRVTVSFFAKFLQRQKRFSLFNTYKKRKYSTEERRKNQESPVVGEGEAIYTGMAACGSSACCIKGQGEIFGEGKKCIGGSCGKETWWEASGAETLLLAFMCVSLQQVRMSKEPNIRYGKHIHFLILPSPPVAMLKSSLPGSVE